MPLREKLDSLQSRLPTWCRGERLWIWLILIAATLFFLWLQGVPDSPEKSLKKFTEKWDAGEWGNTKDYARYGTWLFAWINVGICALLAITLPLWHRRASEDTTYDAPRSSSARVFWIGIVIAVAAGGALRFTTAAGGLWHDEMLNAHRINGYFRFDKEDPLFSKPDFREAGWVDTAFYYRKPTNHVAFSVPSRLSLHAWQAITGADRTTVSPFFLRLPSFLAALGSILLVGLLLRRVNLPIAGVIAAILLAIHPWAIRWSVDARSYGLTIFFALCALYAIIAIVQTNRWRWWVLFGFSQAYLMWLSVLNVYLAAPFALILAVYCFVRARKSSEPILAGLGRLALVNTLAACAFLQLMGPNLIQFKQYTELNPPTESDYDHVDKDNVRNTLSNYLIGIPYKVPTMENDRPITLFIDRYEEPWQGWMLASGTAIFTLSGLLMLLRRESRVLGITSLAVLLSGIALVLVSYKFGLFYYPRFISYLVIPLAIGCGVCWTSAARPIAALSPKLKTIAPLAIGGVGIGFFLSLAGPQISNLAQYPHEPMPQISAALTEYAEKTNSEPLAAGYGLAGDVLSETIDPRFRFIKSRKELKVMMAKSRETGRPLVVTYGVQAFNRVVVPDGFKLLDNEAYFTPLQRFLASDPRHTFFLLEYTGKD